MVDAWLVTGRFTDADKTLFALHDRAAVRVERSPRLRKYKGIIMAGGYASEDHLRWVIRGRVGEIESWAKEIAEDVNDESN